VERHVELLGLLHVAEDRSPVERHDRRLSGRRRRRRSPA
jgi:hypothetical protein